MPRSDEELRDLVNEWFEGDDEREVWEYVDMSEEEYREWRDSQEW